MGCEGLGPGADIYAKALAGRLHLLYAIGPQVVQESLPAGCEHIPDYLEHLWSCILSEVRLRGEGDNA